MPGRGRCEEMLYSIRLIMFIIVFVIFVSPTTYAKNIYDNSGRIAFNVTNDWKYFPMPDNSLMTTVLGISLDNDTSVFVQKSKVFSSYRSMKSITDTDKSIIRDEVIQNYSMFFRYMGYSVSLNKADYFDTAIIAGFTLQKGINTYKALVAYHLKDYIIYSITVLCTPATARQALAAANSLTVDGIPFSKWVKQ